MYLGLKVSMNVTQPVELMDGDDHLCGVEQRILLMHDAGVVQESTEVASRNVFHGEVNIEVVLEGVEKAYKPGRPGSRQDVAFHKHVADLHEAGKTLKGNLERRNDSSPHPSFEESSSSFV